MDDLKELRQQIDKIDCQILQLLANRMCLALDILAAKESAQQPLRDTAREEEVLQKIRSASEEIGLDPSFAVALYRLIIRQSVQHQTARQHLLRCASVKKI